MIWMNVQGPFWFTPWKRQETRIRALYEYAYTYLEPDRRLRIHVVVQQNIFLHPEAFPYAEMIEQRRLLQLNAQIHDRHVGVVKRVQHIRLAKVEFLKLKTCIREKIRERENKMRPFDNRVC